MKNKFLKLTWMKGIFTVILTSIFLFLSQIYASFGGEMAESGFPLHYRLDIWWLPKNLGQQTNYSAVTDTIIYPRNLVIDILFWLIISYILVCFVVWIFRKIMKKPKINK